MNLVILRADNAQKHLHGLKLTCGEKQLLQEICHIAHDSGKLGNGAQKFCKELWSEVGKSVGKI